MKKFVYWSTTFLIAGLMAHAEGIGDTDFRNGIMCEYFNLASYVPFEMPNFSVITSTLSRVESVIDHEAASGQAWDSLPELYVDNFASRHRTLLEIPETGTYSFRLEADDGAELDLDGVSLFATTSGVGVSGELSLESGLHTLEIRHYQSSGASRLCLYWRRSGGAWVKIGAETFFLEKPIGYDFGLKAEYFDLRNYYNLPAEEGNIVQIPNLDAFDASAHGIAWNIRFPSVETSWYGMSQVDYFGVRYEGLIKIDEAGPYVFTLKTDQGARFWVDGELIVDADGNDNSVHLADGFVNLSTGFHTVKAMYYELTGPAQMSLYWRRSNGPTEVVPASVFFHAIDSESGDGDDSGEMSETNAVPAVTLLSPTVEPYGLGNTISFRAAAHDDDNDLLSVAFYANNTLVAQGTRAPDGSWRATWCNETLVGPVSFEARACDCANHEGVSSPVVLDFKAPPAGYKFGVEARYYRLPEDLTILSETNLVGVGDITAEYDRIRFSTTEEPDVWAGLPSGPDRGLYNHYAGVFTGLLDIPVSGEYEIGVQANDGAALSIDGELLLDDLARHVAGIENYLHVRLTAGFHEFRLVCFEYNGPARLSLLTVFPGERERAYAPRTIFLSPNGNPDSDGDGVPDVWETKWGLDPFDSSDGAEDVDADGLDAREEYLAGTDPFEWDTDRDGMNDGWEVSNGLYAYLDDAFADPDEDGLSNVTEYRLNTNPHNSDTDADGVSDGNEVLSARTNPLIPDGGIRQDVLPVIRGDAYCASTGNWRKMADGSVRAAMRSGSLTYRLNVPEEGADALAFRVVQGDYYATVSRFDLSLFVDGHAESRVLVDAPYGESAEALLYFPALRAGEHEFRLVWNNWEVNTFLSVESLHFVRFEGLNRENDVYLNLGTNDVWESFVSPVCVQGSTGWGDLPEIILATEQYETAEVGGTSVCRTNIASYTAVKTIGAGYYADIPISKTAPQWLSVRDIHSDAESGCAVVWKPFAVFAEDMTVAACEEPFLIRVGDSLLLGVADDLMTNLVFTIKRAVEDNWSLVETCSCACSHDRTHLPDYRFDEPGEYRIEVEGQYNEQSSRSGESFFGYRRVSVISSRFPNRNPAIPQDRFYDLSCPGLDPRADIEHDADVSVEGLPREKGGCRLRLYTTAETDLGLVSSLQDGLYICDAVQITPVWYDNGTYCRVAQLLPDGSQIVEVSILLGAVPENLEARLVIFVAGVTFEDGSIAKTLRASDFDEDGACTVRFIRSRAAVTSVCHRMYLRQGDREIVGDQN